MAYNKKNFRRRIKRIFEDGIKGDNVGTKFKDHFDLLKVEAKWLGYNMALYELDIISSDEYAENTDFISKYYNIFIEKTKDAKGRSSE